MRSELERMDKKLGEVQRASFHDRRGRADGPCRLRRRRARPHRLRAPRRSTSCGAWRTQIEGIEASVQAERELDGVLQRGPTGLSTAEVEARFRELESKAEAPAASAEIEGELNALKKKLRVKV